MKITRIDRASEDALKKRVWKLRHDIYVKELNYPLSTSHEELYDPIDDYSVNFLLSLDGCDVGTLRGTNFLCGRLEIESQHESWSRIVHETCENESGRVAELTRLMVRREHRGTGASCQMLLAAFREGFAQEVSYVFLAGKKGPLWRLYRRFGAEVVDPQPRPYTVDGYEFGEYYLMRFNLRQSSTSLAMRYFSDRTLS